MCLSKSSIRGLGTRTFALWLLSLTACGSSPQAVTHPTWRDVEPILRKECANCHGGSAATTGSALGIVYRFDFYDLTSETCGAAAAAMQPARFAAAAASQIAFDITSDSASIRPRMPPEPSPWLADWEWQTLLRWTHDPQKGPAPIGNQPPTIRVTSADRHVTGSFTLSVALEDPDGDSAVGVLTVGDVTLNMDRPGAFAIDIDASQWPLGPMPVSATLCDGWRQATYGDNVLGVFVVGP
jgi:hypothetical protein